MGWRIDPTFVRDVVRAFATFEKAGETQVWEPMPTGNESGRMQAGYYVVACIDILGQQRELDEIKSLAQSPQRRDEFEARTVKCCKRLKLVRDVFTKACEIKTTNPPQGLGLTDEQQKQLDAINCFDPPSFQGFGDTVIAYTRIKNEGGDLTIKAVHAFLNGCAMTLLTCLAEGIPIRGGIDVELGFDCFVGEIYGPALESVHRLETEIAGYPRIVVGDGLFDYLRQPRFAASKEPLSDKYNATLAQACNSIIARDVDSVLIVDYAGAAVRRLFSGWKDLDGTLQKALEFGRQAYTAFVSTRNAKLALRYALLTNYLKSREIQ